MRRWRLRQEKCEYSSLTRELRRSEKGFVKERGFKEMVSPFKGEVERRG